MDNKLMREVLAEFLGTFVLVFVGSAAVVIAPVFGIIVPALAHGLVLVGLIYTYGHVSGAQFNPDATAALWIGGKQDFKKSLIFVVTQFVGGIVAAVLLVALLPPADSDVMKQLIGENTFNYGATKGVLTDSYALQAMIIEAILTFFLVSVIFQAAVYQKYIPAGVAIGFTLAASILAGGVLTGASLNPARTLGPALTSGDLSYVPAYFIGILGGGVIGGLIHGYLLKPDAPETNRI